ncbi:MAG: methyltransferase domain-containing protein [Candidatus Acidiferrales bacterium]
MTVWHPETYLKYANIRFRAALDLIERIPLGRCERAYDLGCGTGHLTQALQERWPEARITGVDSSAEMLSHARGEFPKIEWVQADLTSWRADAPADLLFSNATFQWVPDHEHLLPSLLGQVRKGGFFAMQMPRHIESPGHLLLLETAREERWRERLLPVTLGLVVHTPEQYWRWISPQAARVDIWETIYQHELEGENPVVEFFRGTQLRPYVQALTEDEAKEFVAAYAARIARAFPKQANGKTLFPFRRIFIVAER